MTRQRQRGTAILITMILIVALLGGGAVLVGMQMSSTRSTQVTRTNMTALYCAEAGLNAAKPILADNYTSWSASGLDSFSTGIEPAFLTAAGLSHDVDGDPSNDPDFKITLKDNDDEVGTGLTVDNTVDNDLTIWVISTCLRFADNQKQVTELVKFNVTKCEQCDQPQPPPCCANK